MSDFLGGFRPNRHRERSLLAFTAALAALNASPLLAAAGQGALPAPPTPGGAALQAAVAGARQRLEAVVQHGAQHPAKGKKAAASQQAALEQLRAAVAALAEAAAGVRAPFEWADGPLVQVRSEHAWVLMRSRSALRAHPPAYLPTLAHRPPAHSPTCPQHATPHHPRPFNRPCARATCCWWTS